MKLTVIRNSFLENLQRAGNFVSSRINDTNVLKGVLITADEKEIQTKTTNISEYFIGKLGGKVEEVGSVLVDHKTLIEVIKTINETKISIEKKENQLLIKTKQGQITLPLLKDAEFPSEPKRGGGEILSQELFSKKNLDPILFSCANDEARPVLTGIYFDFKEGVCRLVGTDGFRMATSFIETKSSLATSGPLIVSGRTLLALTKLIKETNEEVSLNNKERLLCFLGADHEIFVRLIEGEYPPYEKVIPQGYETRVLFKKESMLSVLKTTSLFAKEGSNMIMLKIEGSKMEISAGGGSAGGARFSLDVLEKEGKDNHITFNYRFLVDYLNNKEDDDLFFEFNNPFSPGVFYSDKKKNQLYIIMPIRTQD